MAKRKSAPRKTWLFLDYDGVLHRGATYVTMTGPVSSAPGQIVLFEFAGVLEQLLQPYPELRIVLSTDWVATFGFEAALAALPVASLRERVVGATFDPAGHMAPQHWKTLMRGVQVQGFLYRYPCSRWVALDDRLDGFEGNRRRLVLCQEDAGLGDSAVQELLARRLEDLHK